MNLKEIMQDCLEIRGYEVTEEILDELYDIYEDCQEWEDEKMLTGNSYDEVEDFVRHSSSVDEIFEDQHKCPLGGDETDDCADCAYACDYHFVNGECVRREDETK